jgi:rhodanese-related sulfurtransferase
MSSPDLPSVTVAALPEEFVLVDVREQDEWNAGHAPDALHIPLGQIPDRLAELPAGADVVVVCHLGGRSARATAWLNEQGYACRNLTGGMAGYAAAGRKLVSETGAPPIVD